MPDMKPSEQRLFDAVMIFSSPTSSPRQVGWATGVIDRYEPGNELFPHLLQKEWQEGFAAGWAEMDEALTTELGSFRRGPE